MDSEILKKLLDACHEAKKITELMPQLPQRMKPRHIHVIDLIHVLNQTKEYVKVSDISDELKITMPSITKLINELEEMKVITKTPIKNDKRIASLSLTPLGENYYNTYVFQYHGWLANLLSELNDDDILTTYHTISKALELMKANKMEVLSDEQ